MGQLSAESAADEIHVARRSQSPAAGSSREAVCIIIIAIVQVTS